MALLDSASFDSSVDFLPLGLFATQRHNDLAVGEITWSPVRQNWKDGGMVFEAIGNKGRGELDTLLNRQGCL